MQLNKCADGRVVNNMQASSKHMCENPKVFIQPEPEFPALTSSLLLCLSVAAFSKNAHPTRTYN